MLARRQEPEKKAEEAAVKKNEPERNEPEKSAAQQIRVFKELFDSGILTAEEYEAKKKQLLGL